MIKMTDEEMAKEYEEKAEYIEVDDNGHKRYDSIDIEEAFLAGLKICRQNDQFSKAKKIIEKVAEMYRYSPRAEEIIQQAEQFLKEIE